MSLRPTSGAPFFAKRRAIGRGDARPDLAWGVFERVIAADGRRPDAERHEERLVAAFGTRDQARDAASQLNEEEP